MNRKLRVIILTMVLTVLMFGGTRLMAVDNLDVNTTEASQTETPKDEGNLEPKANGDEEAPLVDTPDENTESDAIDAKDSEKSDMGGVTNPNNEGETPDTNQNDKAGNENADKAKDTTKGDANGEKADAPKENGEAKAEDTKDADAQKSLEENKESAKGNGAEDGAPAKAPEAPAGEGEGTGEGEKTKQEVDPAANPDLKALQDQIDAEKDPNKKAELQKKYNDKYLEEIGKSEKLNKDILNRFTDADKTRRYYELKDEYDKLAAQAKNEKLSQKQLDEIKAKLDTLNKELGEYEVPRKLDEDEKNAQDKLAESVDVPGLKDGASTDPKAQDKLNAYNAAKDALKAALDPEKARTTTAEDLKTLLDAFEKAEKELKDGIHAGTITPKYTDGKPTVKVFPLDSSGKVGKELNRDDNTYYIPDNTEINLLVHISKDDKPKDFTFTIKAAEKGAEIKGEEAKNLAFLNGNPVELKKNEDGSYSFTVSSANMNFGIAQLRFNVPGFKAAFHNGFDLEMDLGDGNTVTKQFRITKKGYEKDAKIDGPGSDKDDDPTKIPEIDAGETENAIVDKDTDKVFDFFTYLKKSNTYIDEVTFNSGNGESLPLNSVDITITVPKSGESNFAEMIHKSELEYYYLGNGKYQLKLKTKVFNGNLTKTDEGKLLYNGQELTAANLKDVVLENAGKKVYVDENGAHDIITSEVLTDDGNYKVENGKLYKKNNENPSKFDEIGTFDKDGKIEKGGTTYVLDGNKLITYTKEYDVYDGYVANKDEKADPDVTPTYKGNQVTIETTKDGKTETSYGGTIVTNAKYDKNGKIFNDSSYVGKAGEQVIDSTGKKATGVTIPTEGLKEVKDDNGKLLYKYFVEDGKTYRIVTNAVFKGEYIIDGLEYNEGLSLIDKFGKKMDIGVSEKDGTYTFTRTVKKGDKTTTETKNNGKDGNRTIIVSIDENGQILVNSKNEVIANTGNKYTIVGNKYYYDGEKFVPATGDGLKGNKFRDGYNATDLNPTIINTYNDGKNDVEIDLDKKTKYEGSLNPEDYYIVDGKVYVKKGDIYISANPDESSEILTEKTIAKIVQFLGNGDDAIQKVTDETDIFNAIKNAKFALRFPGFLAGKNVVYNVHADIKATYSKPDPTTGKLEDTDVFNKDEDGIKKIDKFFTLKNEKKTNTMFFKDAPDELTKDPAVNLHFFNIFYRNADDRDRDQLIIDLLDTEAKAEKAKKAIDNAKGEEDKKTAQDAYDNFVKENKEKLALIAKFKKELARLYNDATFGTEGEGNNRTLVIKDKDGNKIEANELNKMRSLLWEVGFENEEGSLFPENRDTEIIIEDHNMDNRLIYDEIIVNDTEENWKKAKDDFEKDPKNKDKKFGNEEYFFLDQIKDIRFGVSPNYIEGRFVPLGENFKITGQEIINKLNEDLNADSVEIEKGEGANKIKFVITRDKANGQVRIKVMNAFYKKVENDQTHKFESPVQKAYQEKIDSLLGKVKNLTDQNIDDFVKALHDEKSECFGVIKEKLTEEFTKINQITDPTEKANKLSDFKKKLKDEIKNIKLGYLDSKKGDYKYDDMRFNAIRIGLNPNITIGGALTPQKIKKLGITSVIVPYIDIPYTDEFGDPLKNKDMYVKAEIENILKNGIDKDGIKKTYKKDDLKNEEKFREIMTEAYNRVNEKIEKQEIEIKNLVTIKDENKTKVGMEKYTVAKGSDLDYKDLAVNDQSLKNKNGYAINPWYIGEGDKAQSVEKRFEEKFGKGKFADKPEYKVLQDMPIDIAAYYMSKQGYDRSRYANQANYKLSGGDKKDGIFGSDSDWHKKICYPGIGYCIEQAGEDQTPRTNPEEGKFGTEGNNGADFELTYEPTNDGPDKENPKVDKKTKDEDKSVDITGDDEKSVDFTIDVTVDKMTKEQKDIADALTPDDDKKMTDEEKEKAKREAEEAKKHYNETTGYYEYENSLIIDILPEIFKLKDGTKLTFEANKDKLMANGANKIFADEKEFEKWEAGIEYFYTDDLEAEYEKLSKSSNKVDKEKAEVLKKAIEDAKANGKIKEGQKVQAVLAWVPKFEAPHGSEKQFTFKLSNVFVDKKKYKDFKDNVIGTNYTNDAAFGDKAKFYFGSTTINIHEDHKGKVNKYLQVLDKDGNVIDKDKADGWFMGGTELKFGDKFNYRIEYFNNTGVVDVPGTANNTSEIKIEDIFAGVADNGLKPVLRDYITSDLEQYSVVYKIGETSYTEEQLKKAVADKKVKLSDVTSVILEGKFENGATNHFDIPMMIPQIDAKIDDNGDVYYTGEDGDKKVIGKAEDFFNLGNLIDKDKELIAKNTVKDSNTVTVYLEKERFIKVFKQFLDANGEKLKDLDNLEAKFDVYQIIKDDNGKVIKKEKVGELKANKANDFTDMIEHLPIFKKTTTVEKNGTVKVEKITYEYVLEEIPVEGFDGKVYKLDDDKELGFVWQAKNTEKSEEPENPGDNPKKEHKKVTVTIRVNKTWEVLNNGSTPSIQVELYANGKATGKVFTLGDGNWSAVFENLPSKDDDGNEIKYTVVEVGSANGITMIEDRKFEVIYKTNEDGSITILNKEVPKEEEHDHEEHEEEKPHDDEDYRDRDQGKNRLPKTGVAEDLASIYFAFVLLLGLVFIKKRYLVK